MQKKELVYVEKRKSQVEGLPPRYALMLDGFLITSFPEDELHRARFAACNLIYAIYRDIVEFNEVHVYD